MTGPGYLSQHQQCSVVYLSWNVPVRTWALYGSARLAEVHGHTTCMPTRLGHSVHTITMMDGRCKWRNIRALCNLFDYPLAIIGDSRTIRRASRVSSASGGCALFALITRTPRSSGIMDIACWQKESKANDRHIRNVRIYICERSQQFSLKSSAQWIRVPRYISLPLLLERLSHLWLGQPISNFISYNLYNKILIFWYLIV